MSKLGQKKKEKKVITLTENEMQWEEKNESG